MVWKNKVNPLLWLQDYAFRTQPVEASQWSPAD